LTKAILEGGSLQEKAEGYTLAGPLPPLAIPSSLQASLMARLDRLAPAREVAQIGAAIGREFSYELLAAVAGRSEAELTASLSQLAAAGLVFRHGTPPHATFSFKHALVQDAAYSTLLRAQRQGLHARIGKILEDRFEQVEARPEILAHHYVEAGLHAQAADWLPRAGANAVAAGANREAAAYYERALASLSQLPQDTATIERCIDLHLELRNVLSPLREVTSALEHVSAAEALARSLGDSRRLTRALTHKMHSLWMEGRLAESRIAGEEAVSIADTVREHSLSLATWLYLGQVYRSLGDYS
jgi:predicted ATPase